MDLLRWRFFILMAALALYIIAVNWWIVVVGMRGRHVGSWIPIVGGLLGFFALRTAPFPRSNYLAPLALFIDPACVPGLVGALVFMCREAGKPRQPAVPCPIGPGAAPMKWDIHKHNTYFLSDELWSCLPMLLWGIGWQCEGSRGEPVIQEQGQSVPEFLRIRTSRLPWIELSAMSNKVVLERMGLPDPVGRNEPITRYVGMFNAPLRGTARREAEYEDLQSIERILLASGAVIRKGGLTTSQIYRCDIEKLEGLAVAFVQEQSWVSTHRWRVLHRRASEEMLHYTLPSGLLMTQRLPPSCEEEVKPDDCVWFEWGICHTPGRHTDSGYVALAVSADFSPDLQQRQSALQDAVKQWLERQGCIAVSFAF